jgi:acyl carrier protein
MPATKTPALVSTEQKIEDCIRSFLENDTLIESAIGVHKSPLRPVVDSLVIVEVLVEVEAVVNCTLPLSLIRRGGYYSVDDAVAHLLPKIMDSLK